jgi:hypothetical protein
MLTCEHGRPLSAYCAPCADFADGPRGGAAAWALGLAVFAVLLLVLALVQSLPD